MKIKYLQHAPRNGEYAGTIFVWFLRAYGSEDQIARQRMTEMLNGISTWNDFLGADHYRSWEISTDKWHTALAILSFFGGTEIQRW